MDMTHGDNETTDSHTMPWDQQEGESTLQYSRFRAYRNLGPERTIRHTVDMLNSERKPGKGRPIQVNSLEQIASRYRWHERAAAWDRHQDRYEDEHLLAEQRRARQDNLALSKTIFDLCGTALTEIEIVNPDQIARLLKVALDLQNAALNGTRRQITLTGPGNGPVQLDVASLTPEERTARFRDLYETLGARLADTDDQDRASSVQGGTYGDHDDGDD